MTLTMSCLGLGLNMAMRGGWGVKFVASLWKVVRRSKTVTLTEYKWRLGTVGRATDSG